MGHLMLFTMALTWAAGSPRPVGTDQPGPYEGKAGGQTPSAPAGTTAQTVKLRLKLLPPATSPAPTDWIRKNILPQSFYMALDGSTDEGAARFRQIVKNEPGQYNSKRPFRGVAKLGSGEYAFVLDSKAQGAKGYGRLYFDRNHNGDLTDASVLDAGAPREYSSTSLASWHFVFPRVDLAIDIDGIRADYAFFFTSDYRESGTGYRYVTASLAAAAYREGQVTLGAKPRRVVVLDSSSSGRFDDQWKIAEDAGKRRRIEPLTWYTVGDKLLFDPDSRAQREPFDYWFEGWPMSTLVNLDGQFYDVSVSAVGDTLVAAPSSVPLGSVTNPCETFRAIVYGDRGCLKISGGGSRPVPLPAGRWKLLYLAISLTGDPPDRAPTITAGLPPPGSAPGLWQAWAIATAESPEVLVPPGQTVPFPFGPPYRLGVDGRRVPGRKPISLRLTMVGSGGEYCVRMQAGNRQPEEPEFTISTPDGKEVEQGHFTAGCDIFPRWYFWKPPSESAAVYHVRVRPGFGPFKVTDASPIILRMSELPP